ncbi:MAG: phosphoribosylformylglycinamidine cyclo-ligase [Clostridia bacterium]|nr:phosphoribosylformylglycinamidine cyclo-ligase [Clostridia bacterium]
MSLSKSESYAKAGVDITAGYEGVKLMKPFVARTMIPGVCSDVGGFGGLFAPDITGMKEPVLVSGTDGCGTKVKLAILMDKHDTIGIDAVAMCVNDIICCGAKPLFFLDYVAIGKNIPEKVASIVSGVAEGCVQSGCALIGGETAEHPGLMPAEDYDLAGFAVGIVDKEKILDNKNMKAGDVVIALGSTGIHSNGFSLCRKVFNIDSNPPALYEAREELGGKSVAEALLVPTRIYVKAVLALIEQCDVKGISHITGGGFYENIPRSIPDGLCAKVDKSKIKVLPIFQLLQKEGNIPERDMYNTYNMGVGMTVVVPADQAEKAIEVLKAHGEDAYVIGEIVTGDEKIELL